MNADKRRWKHWAWLTILAASLAVHTAAGQASTQAQRLSERVEAVLRLRKIVAEHPEDVAARVELGNALDDTGDSAGAIAQYREAILRKPDFAPAYRNLALAHIRQGQWAAAESAARDAVRIEPKNAQARCDLAVALGSQHKVDEAAYEWLQAMGLDKKAVTQYAGFIRTRAVEEEFSRVAPELAARWLVGLTLRDAGDSSRAIREFEKLLETNGNFALANFSIAELYAQTGRQRDGENALQKALQQNPGLKEAAESTPNAASDEATKARLQAASKQLAEFKGIVPNLIQVQHLRGPKAEQVNKARDLLKESAIRMKALLAMFPEDAEGFLLLGNALRELEEPRASWAYETAIRAARGRQAALAGRAWMGLGLLHVKAGSDAVAMEMYSQGLLVAPEDTELLNAAAWLAATSKNEPPRNPQKAVEWAKKAVEATKEKNAAYLSTLAEAYFASGQALYAMRAINLAISLDPDEPAYKKQLERFQKAEK
jgi:tetratricopeptide (TPR) repeat protein